MIEVTAINVLGVAVLGVMLAHWYTPIQGVKEWLLDTVRFFDRLIYNGLSVAFNCSKCSGFILGLILFHDLPAAALTSFIAYLANNIIDRVESWYE